MTNQERDDRADRIKQHEEAAREWVKMHYPKSPEEILMRQVLAGYNGNSLRERDRERFFRE